MSIAYWLKSDCVEVNSAVKDHDEVLSRLSELMNAGDSIDENSTEIFFDESLFPNTDTFKNSAELTVLRFVKGRRDCCRLLRRSEVARHFGGHRARRNLFPVERHCKQSRTAVRDNRLPDGRKFRARQLCLRT